MTTRLTSGKTFVTGDQVTAAGLNKMVEEAKLTSNSVDGSTVEVSDGVLSVKSLGVTSTQIQNNTITAGKLSNTLCSAATDFAGTLSGDDEVLCEDIDSSVVQALPVKKIPALLTGDITVSSELDVDLAPSCISSRDTVTLAANDKVLVADTDGSDALKRATLTEVVAAANGGTVSAIANPGYIKFPGGFTVQWGNLEATTLKEDGSAETTTDNFGIAFTTCFQVVAVISDSTIANAHEHIISVDSFTTTGLTIRHAGVGNASTSLRVNWLAVGVS
jgi:hypothetical protein